MQVQTEAFSMSPMFQGSNCKHFSDILEHLEFLHPTKCVLIPNLLTIVHLILINPATSCTPERSFSVARRIKTSLCSTISDLKIYLFCQFVKSLLTVSIYSILPTTLLRNMMGVEWTWLNLSPVIC